MGTRPTFTAGRFNYLVYFTFAYCRRARLQVATGGPELLAVARGVVAKGGPELLLVVVCDPLRPGL